MSKRHLPVRPLAFQPGLPGPEGAVRLGRDQAMSVVVATAMRVLADAPPGEIAIISACRGAPLCSDEDRASCEMCECVAVSEDGIVGYPGSGRA